MITVQEVIAAVQAGDPSKLVVITAEVWAGKHQGNSAVRIYDGERNYGGSSLQAAFNLYRAEQEAMYPAAHDAEVAAVIGALPQE